MLCNISYKALNNDFDKTKTMKEKHSILISINIYCTFLEFEFLEFRSLAKKSPLNSFDTLTL